MLLQLYNSKKNIYISKESLGNNNKMKYIEKQYLKNKFLSEHNIGEYRHIYNILKNNYEIRNQKSCLILK